MVDCNFETAKVFPKKLALDLYRVVLLILFLYYILFLNMEHSSHKSRVADVTTTGADVIQHKEHLMGRK